MLMDKGQHVRLKVFLSMTQILLQCESIPYAALMTSTMGLKRQSIYEHKSKEYVELQLPGQCEGPG